MTYHLNVIQTECGSVVLLKFVESFTSNTEKEDELVDRLKDDLCFTVRTISGQTYRVSTKTISRIINGGGTLDEIAQAIFDKWKHIHRES